MPTLDTPAARAPAGRVEICTLRLVGEEGKRAYAYNDATGKQVTCRPTGNLSIGYGLNLENGLEADEMTYLLTSRVTKRDTALREFSWYTGLDDVRGSVFLDVSFNVGLHGLLNFTTTLHFAQTGEWDKCAAALLNSKAAKQLPDRYKKLSEIILSGNP